MKDQPSNSDEPVPPPSEAEEPNYGFAEYGTPSPFSEEHWLHFLDDLTEEDLRCDGPHLISVDELRAAGALDVPPHWRKSLGAEPKPSAGLLPFPDDDPPEQP